MLLIVRHGETASNAARVVQTPGTPLNERGVGQAERLASRLVEHHRQRPIGCVVASDLRRAEMTAEPVAGALGLPLLIEPLLAERNFGDLRGRAYADIGLDIMEPGYAPPGGEDWETFHLRVDEAWARIRQTVEATEGDSVFVTHGLVCYSLALRHLRLGDGVEPPTRWGNTSVTHVRGRAPWEASLVNCCDHLDAATADGGQVSGI
ncbi:MAG: histidine phosphatase family protein [Holophagales bacterium]|nr:histidine phosphatase family protein [Holophagales bacterium]